MVQLTFLARMIDGLPLAASMDDNQVRSFVFVSISCSCNCAQDLAEYKNQAKQLLKKISESPHTRSAVDTNGASIF